MCFLGFGHKWKAVHFQKVGVGSYYNGIWVEEENFTRVTYVCEKCKKLKVEEVKWKFTLEDLQ